MKLCTSVITVQYHAKTCEYANTSHTQDTHYLVDDEVADDVTIETRHGLNDGQTIPCEKLDVAINEWNK